MEFEKRIQKALRENRRIVLISYHLRQQGEERLEYAIQEALSHYGLDDMGGPIHAAVRELVQNAAKANLKRLVFEDLGIDPHDEESYQKGMEYFRSSLVEDRIAEYQPRLKARNIYLRISIDPSPESVTIQVENRFAPYPREEDRIRQKFKESTGIDNLYEFYVQHSDHIEGAGMGIAMVEILIRQTGLDSRSFTLFYDHETDHTVGRIYIPVDGKYPSKREKFRQIIEKEGLSPEKARDLLKAGDLKV